MEPQCVGIDIKKKAAYVGDTAEIKTGSDVGCTGDIRFCENGFILIETKSGNMIETKTHNVEIIDRPARMMTQ